MLPAQLPLWAPVFRIERIDRLASAFRVLEVPNGGKGVLLQTIDDDPPGDAKGAINREDFTWGARDDLRLEPAMIRTFACVELPDHAGGDAAEIADQDVRQLAI